MILRFIHMLDMPCRAGFAVLLVLVLSACAQTQSLAPNNSGALSTLQPAVLMSEETGHVVGANDVLTITVFGEHDLSGDYTVAGNGTIDLPLAGPVMVGGQTVYELPDLIADHYRGKYLKDPKVTVALKTARPFYILGEVDTPGSYPWTPNLTVINAVALAHGFSPHAAQNDFDIIRAGQALKTPGGVGLSTPLLPGDVVRVKNGAFR